MDDQGNKIEIKTPMGNTVTLNDQTASITVKSPGNVTIEATAAMSLKAATMTLEATGMMELKTSGMMTISGSLVRIN
jgi:phage baseplate assembly protein gpV